MTEITGKTLMEKAGLPQGKIVGLGLSASIALSDTGLSDEGIINALRRIQREPEYGFSGPPEVVAFTRELLSMREESLKPKELLSEGDVRAYTVVGGDLIDENTHHQMKDAMRIPVAIAGALMPDAHLGYGLPVGGVLATENQVIPWAVGVDIACRMRLSVIPISAHVLGQRRGELADILLRSTQFGAGGGFKPGRRSEHPVLDDSRWELTSLTRRLKDLAWKQLGTSGSGNHFVEWGAYDPYVRYGKYEYSYVEGAPHQTSLAILSHSGSRGVGYKIAQHYSKIAKAKLPKIGHLAWLDLDEEEGQEYWALMELAGEFAKANHEVIHKKMLNAIGHEPTLVVDHHHNFAWKEWIPAAMVSESGRMLTSSVREVVVHRKGATPAHVGALGVIPGSMAQPGYIVSGRAASESLYSASHGAGRTMSRTQALKTLSEREWKEFLQSRKVKLIGGSLDEAPQAYKNIDTVIEIQEDAGLVYKIGQFTPSIVRMDSDAGKDRRGEKVKE